MRLNSPMEIRFYNKERQRKFEERFKEKFKQLIESEKEMLAEANEKESWRQDFGYHEDSPVLV